MAGTSGSDPVRDRLALPLAIGVFALWIASGFAALYTKDVQVLVIVSAPFGILVGYVFGVRLIKRAEDDS